MNGLLADFRLAIRGFRQNPGFAAAAIVSLALGIGLNTAIFSLINAVLLRPLPLPQPERLVSIYHRDAARGFLSSTSFPDYEYYRDHNTVFSRLMAYLRLKLALNAGGDTQTISGELVTPNYFDVLGVHPEAGRTFARDETASRVAIISGRLWREQFSANPRAIGETIHIGGHPFIIIGVAPRSFHGVVLDWGDLPQIWLPLATYPDAAPELGSHINPLREWGMQSFLVTGRLKPGRTVLQARAEMEALGFQVAQANPERSRTWASEVWKPEVYPVQQARFWPEFRKPIVSFLTLLWALAGAVLLVACSNVANLLLTRSLGRRREMAIRAAMGAGRFRLARQLLAESLLLTLGGAVGGLVLSDWACRVLLRFERPFRIPLSLNLNLDGRVLALTALVALAVAIVFGLVPARHAWRLELGLALKSRNSAGQPGRISSRGFLAAVQVALSLVLVVAAGLFVRTLENARSSDVLFRAGHILMAELDLDTVGYSESRGLAFERELLARARSLPGVQVAGLVDVLPLGGMRGATDVQIGGGTFQINMNVVGPGYFEAVGIPLAAGRDFTMRDSGQAKLVAMVNQEMAQRFWPGEDPVGREFKLRSGKTVEVTGVVRDGHMRSFRDPMRPCFYLSALQDYRPEITLLLRTAGDPAAVAAALRREVHVLDPAVAVSGIRGMDEYLNGALGQERLASYLVSALGTLALVLAAIGIYGVISFSVSKRMREFGIRMAVGAQKRDVLAMVAREAALIAGPGVAAGGVAGWAFYRFAKSMLYGIGSADLPAFAAAAALLFTIMMAANIVPAMRAIRVDPASTLRDE